jgi:hypothetical protein
VKAFAGSDDARPEQGATMQNITAQFWDSESLKGYLQEGLERQKTAQFEQDWKRAEIEAAQRISTAADFPLMCRSPRCRRARRCAGTTAPCKGVWKSELKPAERERLVEEAYVRIQQERRAAVIEGRPPRLHDALTGPMM